LYNKLVCITDNKLYVLVSTSVIVHGITMSQRVDTLTLTVYLQALWYMVSR